MRVIINDVANRGHPAKDSMGSKSIGRKKETRYCGLKGGLDQEEINASVENQLNLAIKQNILCFV